jgi:hypothetical protein
MKKLFVLSLLVFTVCQAGFSQLRLHVMGGFANYSGDLQQKRFTLNQAKGVIAAGATYDLTSKFSLRSEYSFAKLTASDKFSPKNDVRQRNLDFSTLLKEVSLMGEYNLFDVAERPLTPYVFAGISVFKYSPYTYTAAGEKVFLMGLSTEGQGLSQYPDRKDYKKTQIALPFGGGLKYALSDDVQIGVELGIRKLFTDYLDDVSTTYVDQNVLLNARGPIAADLAFRGDELKTNPLTYPAAGTPRGGKAKDLYYFGQLRLSFRMPWFDGSGGGRRGRLGCPVNVL